MRDNLSNQENDPKFELQNGSNSWSQNVNRLFQTDLRIGWPVSRPHLNKLDHGWFRVGNSELIKAFSNTENKCIIELGSWLGKSTTFILEKNPNATVFAVDIWSNEHFLTDTHYDKNSSDFSEILNSNPIYYQFLLNMENYKFSKTKSSVGVVKEAGLIPMKMDSLESLQILSEAGVKPDFIYVDANHHYDFVVNDIEKCLHLFPDAIIIGDDWDNADVKRAVKYVMSKHNHDVYVRKGTCWTFAKRKAEDIFTELEKIELVESEKRKRVLELSKSSFASQLEMFKKRKFNDGKL
jgi:hypothetical protein